MEEIQDNDQTYFDWLTAHPEGFVVNSYRNPTTTYMVLHRSTCHHIQRWEGHTSTCGDYKKVVADDVADLHQWASDRQGTLKACRTCQP